MRKQSQPLIHHEAYIFHNFLATKGTKSGFNCKAKLLISLTFTSEIRISARMYRFSNSGQEISFHGTMVEVTLGKDLQADAESGKRVKHILEPTLWHMPSVYGKIKEVRMLHRQDCCLFVIMTLLPQKNQFAVLSR